jgi:hypothetical protein
MLHPGALEVPTDGRSASVTPAPVKNDDEQLVSIKMALLSRRMNDHNYR